MSQIQVLTTEKKPYQEKPGHLHTTAAGLLKLFKEQTNKCSLVSLALNYVFLYVLTVHTPVHFVLAKLLKKVQLKFHYNLLYTHTRQKSVTTTVCRDFWLGGGGGRCYVYLATPIFLQPTLLMHISAHFTYFTLISDLNLCVLPLKALTYP